jgi:dual specificity phosphatase 12
MGKSRSAAVVVAYLMSKYGVSPSEALKQLCEGRPVCGPNSGFMEQLRVYDSMLNAESGENGQESRAIYETWLRMRFTGTAWEWENRGKL